MAKILYGVAGEGHGHATRSLAIISELQKKHEVVALTFAKSTNVMSKICRVIEIPGFTFGRKNGRISFTKTAYKNVKVFLKNPLFLQKVQGIIKEEKPDLLISDFEPLICRASWRIPIISIDNQQLLRFGKYSIPNTQIPNYLVAQSLIRAYYMNVKFSIVTHFSKIPLRSKKAVLVDPIIRPEVISAKTSTQNHILVYLRSNESDGVIPILEQLNEVFHVFGISDRESASNVHIHEVFSDDMLKYLASAKAVICTAGLSLMSESLYLQKPLFVLPEKKDFEQFFNAAEIKANGYGDYQYLHKVTLEELETFLQTKYKKPQLSPNGAKQAANLVNEFLIEHNIE